MARTRKGSASDGRKSRKHLPPQPSPRHTPTTPRPRHSTVKKQPARALRRCSSEPAMLWSSGGVEDDASVGHDLRQSTSSYDGAMFVFASSPSLVGATGSPRGSEGSYSKDAKVVVNVTVEGSPGPVRIMVKLGSTIENAIRLAVSKYKDERRMPKLDCDGIAGLELHHSYFSLQCLDKSGLVGDVGSRSFYLRKSQSGSVSGTGFSASFGSADKLVPVQMNSPPAPPPAVLLLPNFVARKLCQLMRRLHKFWRIVICSQQD